MRFTFTKTNIACIVLAPLLIVVSGCSNKSDAQTNTQQATTQSTAKTTAKTDGHTGHKHGEAPALAAQTAGVDSPLSIPSGRYILDPTHGYVTFSYVHKGLSRPQLRFNNVDAQLILDAARPENSNLKVRIDAANIDSGVAKFDAHLKSADFFNIDAHPQISFTSTGFARTDARNGTMAGDLTLMGITKSINFDVNLVGVHEGAKPALGIEARAVLKRSDFGLGKYVPHVGDDVTIAVFAEFHKGQ